MSFHNLQYSLDNPFLFLVLLSIETSNTRIIVGFHHIVRVHFGIEMSFFYPPHCLDLLRLIPPPCSLGLSNSQGGPNRGQQGEYHAEGDKCDELNVLVTHFAVVAVIEV
jgi:hypothetical protein